MVELFCRLKMGTEGHNLDDSCRGFGGYGVWLLGVWWLEGNCQDFVQWSSDLQIRLAL